MNYRLKMLIMSAFCVAAQMQAMQMSVPVRGLQSLARTAQSKLQNLSPRVKIVGGCLAVFAALYVGYHYKQTSAQEIVPRLDHDAPIRAQRIQNSPGAVVACVSEQSQTNVGAAIPGLESAEQVKQRMKNYVDETNANMAWYTSKLQGLSREARQTVWNEYVRRNNEISHRYMNMN
jgi:hypothetical protein